MLTALENVELPLKLTNLKKAERMEHAATALKLVGLGDRLHHLPRQLSGGQEQRVAIARAIVTDPALILADEPTGNLDAASAQEVLTILSRLNKEFGKTVVMVTHDPHAAQFATQGAPSGEGRADSGKCAKGSASALEYRLVLLAPAGNASRRRGGRRGRRPRTWGSAQHMLHTSGDFQSLVPLFAMRKRRERESATKTRPSLTVN